MTKHLVTLDVGAVAQDREIATHEGARAGEPVHLTPNEFRLPTAPIRGRGKVLTNRQLLMDVWGSGYADRSH